jgi:hypothetical protein
MSDEPRDEASEPEDAVSGVPDAIPAGAPETGLSDDDVRDAQPSAPETSLSDDDIRDALPDDLDASGYVGPYLFPNNNRRRIPAIIYWVIAAVCIALWWSTRDGDQVLVNGGYLAAAVILIAFGAYSFVTGWNLDVDERDALVAATKQVGFPVGHASAQMGWRGLLSRPTWRILLYSAENPPEQRGLVLIDGVDGDVVEWFVEANPEDWSELDA